MNSALGIFAPTNKRARTFIYEPVNRGAIKTRARGRRTADRVAAAFADNETFTPTQVAALLNLSVQTIRNHLAKIEKGLTREN